jgi:hypothetical protein
MPAPQAPRSITVYWCGTGPEVANPALTPLRIGFPGLAGNCIEVERGWVEPGIPLASVQPATLEAQLWPQRILPSDFDASDLTLFFDNFPAIDQRFDRRPLILAQILAADAALHAAATYLLSQNPSQDLAICYWGLGRMTGPLAECRPAYQKFLTLFVDRLRSLNTGPVNVIAGTPRQINSLTPSLSPSFSHGPLKLQQSNRQPGLQDLDVLWHGNLVGDLRWSRADQGVQEWRLFLHPDHRKQGIGRAVWELSRPYSHGQPVHTYSFLDEDNCGFLEALGFIPGKIWQRAESRTLKSIPSPENLLSNWGREAERGLRVEALQPFNRAAAAAYWLSHVPQNQHATDDFLNRLLWEPYLEGFLAWRDNHIQAALLYSRTKTQVNLEFAASEPGRHGAAGMDQIIAALRLAAESARIPVFTYEYLQDNYEAGCFAERFFGVPLRQRQQWTFYP